MKKEEVIEIARKSGANDDGHRFEFNKFKCLWMAFEEVERRTFEHAATEAERMARYPGGKQQAPAHDTVWHAARAIRALKESK